jgi:hypothetical protein
MNTRSLHRLSFALLLGGSLLVGTEAGAQTPHPLGLLPETNRAAIPAAPRIYGAVSLPSSVDLTSELPLPGDQASQGSCVGFAVGYAYKSFQEAGDNGWTCDTNAHIFSPSYIYNQIHANNSSDGGGASFSDAFNLLQNQGCATLNVMPYDGSPYAYTTQPTATVLEKASQYKSSTWAALPTGDYNEVRSHLGNGDVVVMGIPVYPDFDNLNASNPIYDDGSGSSRGNHALAIVGYDDSMRALKFINSWGTGWGLSGYGWMSYDLFASVSFGSYVMTDLPESPLYSVDTAVNPVDLGTSLPPQMTKNFTVEMWVKPGATQQTYADIIDFNHRANVGMVFQQNVDSLNQFFFGIGNGSTSAGILYQLQTDAWQHVAFEREGTVVRLYVDGNLVDTQPCFADDVYYLPGSGVTVAYNVNYGRYFNGTIKGLKFWNYARSPASLQSKSMGLATFAFNGSTDGLGLGGGLVPKMVGDFSIEMWVYPGSTQQTYADIVDFNHRSNVGLVIQQDGNNLNQFVFAVGNNSTSAGILYQLQTNTWQHVRFERRGAELRLYINSSLVATQPCFAGDIYYLPGSNVTVGYNVNYGRYFNGTVYDLKFMF